MKNSIRDRAKLVPTDIKLMVDKSMSTARKIMSILDEKGKDQKYLAELMNKKESEISKWLQGTHNFTYRTICKIEDALGEEIITIPDQVSSKSYTQFTHYILDSLNSRQHSFNVIKNPERMSSLKEGTNLILGGGAGSEYLNYADLEEATFN